MAEAEKKIRVWEEEVIFPTYEIGEPEKNPVFLEKRVYQGSCGKVYPYPTVEKISDEKKDKRLPSCVHGFSSDGVFGFCSGHKYDCRR